MWAAAVRRRDRHHYQQAGLIARTRTDFEHNVIGRDLG
jgi:hypothetical protein